MSFHVARSGMNAATQDLNVTSHNIANSNTTGFKQSRAEFADLFPVSTYGLSGNAVGAGVKLAAVAQQFGQGNVEFSGRALDLAISGEGFFTLSDRGATVYSRAGNFGADDEGFVTNPAGHRLQVFPPNSSGTGFDTGRLGDLQLAAGDAPPLPSSRVTIGTNLPANAEVPTVATFDAADPDSWNHTTSLTVYDSLGAAHTQTLHFVKTDTPNQWQVHTSIDGQPVGTPSTLQYSETGALESPAPATIALDAHDPGNGAAPMQISLDMGGSSQYGERFTVSSLSQDGHATGRLTGIEISAEGVVQARYTNGVSRPLGQVAMTNFANPQGLQSIGDNAWSQTAASGDPRVGTAGSSEFGLVQGGALEASNVDLTEQLVNMITAQRNFQANAQMISTQDQVTQTVINIR